MKVVILRGVSCSGKDTFCKSVLPKNVLSSDALRGVLLGDESDQSANKFVFSELRRLLNIRLSHGAALTVINATNLKASESKEYFDLAEKWGAKVLVLSLKPCNIDEFNRRNAIRVDQEGRNIPLEVFERQCKTYENNTLAYKQFAESRGATFIEKGTHYEFSLGLLYDNPEVESTLDEDTHEIYAIGDVHGCLNELIDLTENCMDDAKALGKKPVFVQLGDILDRGPNSFGVLGYSSAMFQHHVMGNHEWLFLRELYGMQSCRSSSRQVTHQQFSELSDDFKADIIKKLTERKHQITITTVQKNQYIFTHSPLKGFDDLNNTGETIRDYAYVAVEANFDKLKSLNSKFRSTGLGKRVNVYGHQSWKYIDIDVQIAMQRGNKVKQFNIDSGCVYGKTLTAMRVRDEKIFQVQSGVNVEKDSYDAEMHVLLTRSET